MKNEQEQKRDIIDRVLDNEVDERQRQALIQIIESDPALKEEYAATARVIDTVKTGERVPASAFFTQEVMKRLPQPKTGFAERAREFLFKGRVLRWNAATALSVAVIVSLAFTLFLRDGAKTPDMAVQQGGGSVIITMNFYAPDAHQVSVAGTFNKWRIDANLLRKGENGYWTISIPLPPGDHVYMFVVDGKAWVTDPNAESFRDDGFGNRNAVVRVKI